MFGYIGIIAVTSILGMVISRKLKLSFSKYAQIPIQTGLSGKEIAEAMLKQHGITDVKVVPRKGNLTDHYNPLTNYCSERTRLRS